MAKQRTPAPEEPSQTTQPTFELQDQIRLRAYELYEQRGREHGHELDDWLRAERELTRESPGKIEA